VARNSIPIITSRDNEAVSIYPIQFIDRGEVSDLPAPLVRLSTCGGLTIEVLEDVISVAPPQARYRRLSPDNLRGRGIAPASNSWLANLAAMLRKISYANILAVWMRRLPPMIGWMMWPCFCGDCCIFHQVKTRMSRQRSASGARRCANCWSPMYMATRAVVVVFAWESIPWSGWIPTHLPIMLPRLHAWIAFVIPTHCPIGSVPINSPRLVLTYLMKFIVTGSQDGPKKWKGTCVRACMRSDASICPAMGRQAKKNYRSFCATIGSRTKPTRLCCAH
jgi:hypothetical protein